MGKEVVLVVKHKGRHVAEGDASAQGEAGNDGDVDLDGPPGERVNGGELVGDLEAGLFGQRAGNQVEGSGGVQHPTVRAGIHKDRNFGEAERVGAHLQLEGVAGLDRHGRVGRGQGQQLQRHLDPGLLVGVQIALEAGFECLIGLGCFAPVAAAEIILRQGLAQQLFMGGVAAGRDLIHQRL